MVRCSSVRRRTRTAASSMGSIAAFGEQADHVTSAAEPAVEPLPEPKPPPAATKQMTAAPDDTMTDLRPPWPAGVAKHFPIRYPNPELSIALAELARLEERS